MLRAEDLTPADLFQVLWKQRLAIVAVALCGAALAYGWSLFLPDLYTAETLVLIEDSEQSGRYARAPSAGSLRARLNTLSEQVLSRTRLENLVDEYDLVSPGGNRADTVASVRRKIVITTIGTDGFRLSFTHRDPEMAARVTNALADFYIEESTTSLERQVAQTAAGLQQQVDEQKSLLDRKEQQIIAFKSEHMGALPDQLGSNLSALGVLRQQIRSNNQELSAARAELAALPVPATSMADTESMEVVGARDAARQILAAAASEQDLTNRLARQHPQVRYEARSLQRQALLRQYTERHPDVRRLTLELDTLRGLVASADPYEPVVTATGTSSATSGVRDAYDSSRAGLQGRIAMLETERRTLLADVQDYESRIDRSPAVEQQLREMERDHESMVSNYNELVSRTLDAELATDMQVGAESYGAFRVIDRAVVPERPSSPQRFLFLLGGLLVGAGLVVGIAMLREIVLEPLNSGAEVERFTDIAVLATIPVVRTEQILRRQRLVRLGSVTAVGAVLVVVIMLRVMMRGM